MGELYFIKCRKVTVVSMTGNHNLFSKEVIFEIFTKDL